jgi:hypothetical protein
VAAVTPAAAYLTTGDADLPALCLGTRDAVRLPCTLVIDAARADAPFAGWRVGLAGVVGDGGVRVGDRRWRVTRWWRPARPGPLSAPPTRLRAAAADLAAGVADPLDPAGRAAVDRLTAALRAGADPAPAVRDLLGRGPGLTPLGDDVLAGALVTVHAYGHPAAGPLAAAVAGASARTTVVSAALLAHAARGECVAALAGLLGAVGRGGPDLAGAAAAVAAVGHTSGAGLVRGVVAGLSLAGSSPAGSSPAALSAAATRVAA